MTNPSRISLLLILFIFLVAALPSLANPTDDFDQAQDWFIFGEYDKALNRATSLIESGLIKGNRLRESHVLRARCLIALDRPDEAQDAFRKAIAVSPDWKPDPVQYTGSEIRVFEAAVEPSATRSLTTEAGETEAVKIPEAFQSPAKREIGFFIGFAGSALVIDGKGTVGSTDYDFQHPLYNELEDYVDVITDVGFGWDNTRLMGFKPIVGYRLTPRFSISGSYQFWLKKASNNNYYVTSRGAYENAGGEWSQSNFQVVGQFYTSPNGIFYLIAGFETVSATVTLETDADWIDENDVTITKFGSFSEDIDLSGSGFIAGLGADFVSNPNGMNLYGLVTYSLTKTSDVVNELDTEFNVGGLGVELGVRYYFTKP